MGLLARINDIVRSNLNDLVGKAENPEKLLNQAILDMEEHLRRARKLVLDTVASEKVMEHKRAAVLETAARWERRAALALTSGTGGDEDLARLAIMRKVGHEHLAGTLENQIRVQREYVGAIKQALIGLEERYREARARKLGLVARAKAAKTRRATAEQLAPEASTKSTAESRAFDTFDRMEDKVLELEAQAEAFLEMARPEGNGKDEALLDAKFTAMEKGGDIEDRLRALKEQVASKSAKA